MKIQSLRTLNSGLSANQLQSNVSSVMRQFQLNPLLIGSHLLTMKDEIPSSTTFGKEIPITLKIDGGGNPAMLKIPHGLSQRPTGYLVLSQDANANIYQFKPTTEDERKMVKQLESRYLLLMATAEVTITLWVF